MALSEKAKTALAKLGAAESDEIKNLVPVFTSELEELDAKNYTVIGERRDATTKLRAVELFIKSVGKALGIEGDVDSVMSAGEEKVSSLASAKAAIAKERDDFQKRAIEAEAKNEKFETSEKRRGIAKKAGVDPEVFGDLFDAESLKKFSVGEDGVVSFDGKPFSEYVEGDDRLKRYKSVLFVDSKDDDDGKPPKDKKKAPSTPPGKPEVEGGDDPLSAYMSKTYGSLVGSNK